MMKRYLVGVVIAATSISLAACGSNDTGTAVPTSNNRTTVASLTGDPVVPSVDETVENQPTTDVPRTENQSSPRVTDTKEMMDDVTPAPPDTKAPTLSTPSSPAPPAGDSTPASESVILKSDTTAPAWYVNATPASTPGEFTTGDCRGDLHYYPVRTTDADKDAVAHFSVRNDGISITVSDPTIRAYGFMVDVSPTTGKAYTVSLNASAYFIPNADLGEQPGLTKQYETEIGMCATQMVK